MRISYNISKRAYLIFCQVTLLTSNLLAQSNKNNHVFQLNHVDICIDSISFNAILKNDYVRSSFAYVKVFKDSTGTELLILGKESFIHLLPAKGFFNNRLGACLLVHHSYQWRETEKLTNYLQSFTKDSLYNRPYNSPNLNIDYINVYENLTAKDSLLKFIPILQNHSRKDYMSWGYTNKDLQNGISQKQYMTDYVGKETEDKLFEDIDTITASITNKEWDKLQSLLKAYGYKRKGYRFLLPGNPILILNKKNNPVREIQLTIQLSKSVKEQIIYFSNSAKLLLKDKTAIFVYSTSKN